MPGQARVNDITLGIGSHGLPCCPHVITGYWIQGSPDVFTNSLATIRIGDIGLHDCPHCPINIAATGSPTVFTNGIANHRLGDTVNEVCGTGVTITASTNVIVNG